MEELRQRVIITHYKNPQNYGVLKDFDHKFDGQNPFCGDELTYYVKLDGKKRVKNVGWTAKGCVISKVSASILSEVIKGKTLKEIEEMDSKNLLKKIQMQLSPIRMKCALLSLYTIARNPQER